MLPDRSRSPIPRDTEGILRSGGWDDVSMAPCVRTVRGFGTDEFETAVEGSLAIGGAARLLLNATDEQRAEARRIAERVMRGFWSEDGAVVDGACWLVTAQRP